MTHLTEIERLAIERLTPEEQDVLASLLWRNVHVVEAAASTETPDFSTEIQRRMETIKDGTAKLYSHAEVMAELRARCK